jgi:hypothetical protein
MWQYKHAGTHDKIILRELRHILDKTCMFLGYDYSDRSVIFLLIFSDEPFDDHQLELGKIRESYDGFGMGCMYEVEGSRIGGLQAEGLFPSLMKDRYFRKPWPDRLYLQFEIAKTGRIVN